ncbi:GTPase domain-containing protein [Parabacteroides sp. PF5-9]|uniref:GTPase domain-containing protein n=1 Tax=Parabacteroides sp. PF5-9 TaxID=1742404 RepID=UPI002475FE20|nr:GTPase domain-containing protein [Parabacteroides sp. PF5-9]MDH6357216.1 hypothetical protein [Parabacteroides sp. PF5-9]
MKRAYSPIEILKMKKETFPFSDEWMQAFSTPERTGVWFIWGNSGNGKSSFVMQLCAELGQYEKIIYNSLEEGTCLTMQNTIRNFNMQALNKRLQLVDCEPMDEFSERLSRHKAPKIAIIDSFQYTQMSYRSYIQFKERHRNKLLIFISHADGGSPSGRSAKSVMYDAGLKIWVQGYRAFSKGRYIGETGYFDIWPERAQLYWGETGTNIKKNI